MTILLPIGRKEMYDMPSGSHLFNREWKERTFSFRRASLTGFDLGGGKGGLATFSSGILESVEVLLANTVEPLNF